MQETILQPAPPGTRWGFLREALAGTQQDFTQGSLTRGIALLAIPTVLEMSMESTFGLVDGLWVARLGADSLAAVGLTEALIVLVFGVAIGLSMAATATVARRIGEKDPDGAAVAAVQAIVCGMVVSLVTGALGGFFAPKLLALMNAGPEVIRTGAAYSRILLSFDVCIVMLFLINGIFRGAGDAAIAMRTLWLANGINLVLDPCFIYGIGPFPRMGVTGAAVATTIGRGIGVIYGVSVLLRGKGRVAVAARHLCLDWPVLRRLIRLSGAAMVQYLISTASWLSLARINAAFGSSAVAGYTIGIRMITFAILPSWGISSAAATLVGQNLGAKRPDRAERAVWLAGGYNMAFLTLVGVAFLIFARPIVAQFTTDPNVVAFGVATLQFVSIGYPFYAWGMVMEQAFNGAGDTVTPTWINLGCYWFFQFPLAMLLAFRAGLGPRGVYLGICLAETLLAAVSVIWFRRGRWKTVQL